MPGNQEPRPLNFVSPGAFFVAVVALEAARAVQIACEVAASRSYLLSNRVHRLGTAPDETWFLRVLHRILPLGRSLS